MIIYMSIHISSRLKGTYNHLSFRRLLAHREICYPHKSQTNLVISRKSICPGKSVIRPQQVGIGEVNMNGPSKFSFLCKCPDSVSMKEKLYHKSNLKHNTSVVSKATNNRCIKLNPLGITKLLSK